MKQQSEAMKLIKVRIAVAVYNDDTWQAASGGYGVSDQEQKDDLSELIGGYQVRWVEAEIPAYEEPVSHGENVK